MTLPYTLEQDLMDRKTKAVELFKQGYGSDLSTLGRLISIHNTWPDLGPGAKLAFAQAGLTAGDPAVQHAARLQAAQNINRDAWMKALPQTQPSQRHIDSFIQRVQKVGNVDDFKALQNDPLFKQLPKATQKALGAQAIKGQFSDGLLSGIMDDLGYSLGRALKGDVVGAVAGGGHEQAVPQDQDLKVGGFNLSQTGRDIVRETANAGISGLQATQGVIRNEVGGGTPLFSGGGIGLAEQTNLGQEVNHGLSAGDGILPDPNSPAALAAAGVARQTAPTIDGHAWTLGRATASFAGDVLSLRGGPGNPDILQPGSTGYNLLSGLVDAGVAIKGDPTAQILGGIGELRAQGQVFTPEHVVGANAVSEETGLAPLSTTPEAIPGTKTAYLNGPALVPKFQKLADTTSASGVIDYLGGTTAVSPELAQQLADAPDVNAVRQVFQDNTLPYKPTFGGLGYETQARFDSRMLATMPDHTLVDMGNKADTWTQMNRDLQAAKVPEVQRHAVLDKYLASETPHEALDAFSDSIEQMILAHRPVNQKLLDQASVLRARAAALPVDERDPLLAQARDLENTGNAPAAFAKDVARTWGEQIKLQKSFDVDQATGLARIRPGMVEGGQGQPFDNATADSERLNSLVRLPNPRLLRKLTTKYGALIDNAATNLGSEAVDGLINAWKTTVVARPQLFAKIAGETQFNLAMRDYLNIFTHPVKFMNVVAGTNMDSDSRLLGLLTKFSNDPSFMWNVKGEPILDKNLNLLQRSLRYPGQDPEPFVTVGFHNAPVSDPKAAEGLVESLGRMYTDPIFRGVAQAPDPAAAKDWFWGATSESLPGDFQPTGEATAEGLPELFHGTSQRFQGDAISVGSGSGAGNLMGPGFYSTDNPEVAASYMQKGRGAEPHVYSTRWEGSAAPRILDAEKPVSSDVAATVKDWWRTQIDNPAGGLDVTTESAEKVSAAIEEGAPLSRIIGDIRSSLASTGDMPRSEANDVMDGLAYRLQDHADVLRYSGGVRTGNQTHNAYVFLDESNVGVQPLRRGLGTTVETPLEDVTGKDIRLARAPITAHDDAYLAQAVAAGKYGPDATHYPVGDIANDRPAADSYIDNAHYPRINDLTGGHEDLLEAVRTGKLNGKPLMIHVGDDSVPNPAAVDEARAIMDAGYGPRAWVPVRDDLPLPTGKPGVFNKIMDGFFHYMIDVPDKVLDRVPAYAQAYWKRAIDHAPYVSEEDFATLTKNANKANLPDDLLNRLHRTTLDTSDTPRLSLDQVHDASKAMALHDLSKVAHDLTTRTNLFDRLRWFIPFGDAWRLVMKRGAQLIADEPQVLQRLNTGFWEAKQPGSNTLNKVLGNPVPAGQPFFHKDPVTGDLSVSVPGTGILTQATFGVPIPLDSSVKGLTMASDAMPGIGGPLLTLPAKWLLPETPTGNAIKHAIFPFGGAESQGPGSDLASQFVPAWALKLSQSYPNHQAYATSFNLALKTLASTGDYNKPDELSRLMDDAKEQAKWMYTIRGAAQFLVPGAPTEQNLVKGADDKWVDATVLAKAYRDKQEQVGSDKATQWLINHWGVNNIFATQAASSPVGYAAPVTTKAGEWVDAHPDVRTKYPLTFGLIVPAMPGDKLDPDVYAREVSKGARQPLSEAQQVAQAENRLGFYAYNKAVSDVTKANGGIAPDKGQREDLATYRRQLEHDFPGFDTFTASPYDTTKRRKQAIEELGTMLNDKSVMSTDAGQGLAQYFQVRHDALVAASDAGLSTFFAAKAARPIRDQLRDEIVPQIIKEHPEFAPMWNEVFAREMVSN